MERGGQGSLFIDKLCNNKIEGELWRKKILFLTVGCINYNCDINFYEPLKQIFSHVINYNYIEKIKQIGKDSMNAEVIEIVRKEKPDYVLLHTYQDQIELKTLDAIGALGTKVIAWFSDDHWRFENYSKIVARHVFCSVTTDKHSVEKYVKSGLNVVKSQWASNQNYYKKIDSKRIYDVTFVGQNYGRRRENLLYLKNNGVPIVVFGRGFGRFLEFDDIIKTFNASKINLNFSGSSSNDDIKQIKGRVFEVPMCGGFLLTEYVDGIEEHYEIGKEIECFENITEASEKISYYLKHDDKRIEIANRGYSRALKDHTWVKRLRGLFDELNKMQLAQSNVSCTFLPQEKEAVKPVNISHPVLRRPRKQVLLTTSAAPTQSPFSTKEKRPPNGIGFLISVLRNAGHKVFFIDNYLQPSNFLETNYLRENEIDYLGIYADTVCFRDTLRMIGKLEYLRQTHQWSGKIIVGGPHATVAPDTIPGFVDYVVQGEGEQAILDIVDGKITQRIVNYPRIKDLDTLPMPAWDYFVGLPYDWSMKFISDGPVFTMNTSRGCPFRCAFCSVSSVWGKKYTYFSAERIVSDIEYLIKRYGLKGVYFREDNFTTNKRRLRKFCNLLIEKGIKISWVCESRVSNLSRDLVELMSRAGAKGFYLGVESGSQRILDFLHKDITVEQIKNAFKWCREFGIKTAASIIIGVPGETESDLYETNKLLREANPTAVWPNVFVGIPYSDLYHFVANNRLYQYIDDRGLVYLPGHNSRVKHYYRDSWNASIPDTEENKDLANKPKVSVLICVYNGEKFVRQALESIYNQTYQNFEVIIVDDGSTDRTSEILRDMKDSRTFIYRNSQNKGLTKSLNIGLKLCRGDYIARMDADDISAPHRFTRQIEFLQTNPHCALVGSSYYRIDEEGKIISLTKVLTGNQEIKQGLKNQNWFGHGTVMVRRAVLLEVGGYSGRYEFAQDYDLWLRIAEKYKVGNIGEPLYYWRWASTCISNAKKQEQQYYKNLAISEAQNRQNSGEVLLKEKCVVQDDHVPLVSVIVPTYNRPASLVKALKSVLNQTYQNFEIIVINDAGTDVEDIVRKLNAKQSIVYSAHDTNKGLAATRNTGIKAARGKYIAYLDDDDVYLPDHLGTLVKILESTDYKVAYTNAYRAHYKKVNGNYAVTKRTVPYSFDVDHNQLLVRNLVPVLCVMHEKSCLDEVGYFDESLPTHEDWDLWIRMSRKFKFFHIKKVTAEVTWRTDGTTMTGEKKADFLRVPEIIYNKYEKYTVNKPNVVEQQRKRLQNLKQRYRQTFLRPVQDEILPAESKLQKLNFAIKTCTPSREKKRWGDTYFANSLAKAFMKLGNNCEVHFRDEWNQPDNHIDVVIHIKGRFRYIPKPHNFNILWIISHPELHAVEEINQFDVVFCASKLYFENLKGMVKIPCFYLPQAADEDLFKPPNNVLPKDIDILFVGTNYYAGKRRKIIQDVLDTGQKYNLCVVGKFWNGLLDKECYKAEYVEHSKLPQLYSRAKIVLNDHHETMKQFGFINNRTFDLAALKVFQISDYVKGIEELEIVTYQTPEDLREKLDYFLQNEKERERIAAINNQLCKNFTFINAERQIFDVVNKLSDEKSSRKIKDKRILPSEGKSADTLSAVSTSRSHPKVSVVVSCCNSEKFLSQCLDSIRSQTMHQWELFLLDDASTDGTRSIIEEYSRMDERIRPYYFQDNKGPYVRRNFAIERAGSDFIVIQDADDIMCPTKLEILYNEITKDQRLGIVGSFYRRFLEEFKALEYTEKTELLVAHDEIIEGYRSRLKCDFCWHGSAIIRKGLFEAIGLYDENPFGSDSFWLAKAAEYAYYSGDVKLKNIPEYLTLRRMHPASQMRILPSFDPRGRRRRYWQYCEDKLKKMRQRLERPPHTDIKTELKNCVCSDFIEKYSHLFTQWESEPLDDNVLLGLMSKAVELFNNRRYVTCIVRLNGIETIDRNIAKRFKNYDLLRAMAYFAIDRKEQSLSYLNREIQNHESHAAKQFISDYFEKQSKTTVQNWCQQNSELYDLRLIDAERESATEQKSRTVSGQQVAVGQSEQGHSSPNAFRGQVKPKVSIVTSCYNAEKLLSQCLDSIRNQTMNQWELFLLDDASTDGTRSIIEEYSRMDKRIKPYCFQDNKGPYVRRNFAIERAGSDFIVIQDADDIMCPTKLEALYRQIISDEQLGIVGAFYRSFLDEFKGLQYTDGHELPLEHNEIVEGFSSWRHVMSHGSAIIQKKLFEEIGLYDENRFSSDAFWFAKLAEYTKHCTDVKLKTVPEYLTLLRIHHSSQTQLLPGFDPRSRRIRYQRYCEEKLRKIRQNLKSSPDMDIKTELKNCVCSDFNEKYSHLFAQWESEPLDNNILINRINWAVELFNRRCYVRCVSLLNCIETMDRNIVKRFKNYDLLRAMACFAVDRKEQSLSYLNREIQNHNNPAAKQFISDCFESHLKTDIQDWCSENGKLYDLRMIDAESEADIEQRSHTVSDEHIAVRQDEKGHSPQKLSCEQPISRGSAIMTDTDLARDMLLRLQKKDDSTSGGLKILFYFDRIGNFSRSNPAGTVIAVLNFARALLRNMPEASIHLTGNLVRYPEQYESFQIIPLPQADKRDRFIADYDVVFFATHVRYFQSLTKPSEQIWVLYQHCWEADDPVSLAHMNDFDAVICLSELHKASLLSQGIGAEKLVAVPNLVDTDIYSPGDISRNNQSIMYAGGIHPHKCIHILLDAFQLVRQQTPEAELHIYGDGAMWRGGDDYGNLLKSTKPQGVHFHGYIDNKDMPQIYSKHSILCLPSRLESFGLVTVEAQACGCIPVVHNVGGVAATLADGQTGFLYSPNTPEKLAETIIKAMTIVDTDSSIRHRAIDFVRDNFSTATEADYISELWERLAAAREIGTVRALFESNNTKLAGAGCERLLQKYPDQPDLLLLRALIALHRGDKDGCKSILLSMVEKFGPHQMALNSLGVLSMNEDDHDKALEYFVKAYNVNTSDRNTTLNCSIAWKMCGKYEEARMVLFMYLTKVGADAQVLQLLKEINNLIAGAGSEVNVMAQQQKSLSEHKTGDRLTVIPHYEPGPSDPLVSVIMPVYNCAEYIGQSIESVLIQNYPKFELIIVDDGSMDNTREEVLRYDDERITYIYQQNNGPSSARNRAIRQAKGQYIMPLDADDMMTPDCIILHLQEFKKYPEADLIYCDVLLIDGNGNPIRVMNKPEYHDRRHLIRDLFRQGHPIVPFRLGIRRNVFDRIGFYDEQLAMPEDYDMVRRFVKAGLKEHHLRQTLHLRRMQPESLSRSMNINKARDHFEVISRIVETFDCEQLFPDVDWSKIPAEKKEFHAKCLIGATYLDIGRRYIESKQPIMSQLAFEQARLELNGYIKIDPGNRRIRQLLQKSGLLQAGYEQGVQQAVC